MAWDFHNQLWKRAKAYVKSPGGGCSRGLRTRSTMILSHGREMLDGVRDYPEVWRTGVDG